MSEGKRSLNSRETLANDSNAVKARAMKKTSCSNRKFPTYDSLFTDPKCREKETQDAFTNCFYF